MTERKLIRLNSTTVMKIDLFTRINDLLDLQTDCMLDDGGWKDLANPDRYRSFQPEDYEEAARETIRQLQEQWCVTYLEALRGEIDRVLDEHAKETGRNLARIDEETQNRE